jgi:hypothetical protein
MNCPKCGTYMSDNARYCTGCGTDVLASGAPAAFTPKHSENRAKPKEYRSYANSQSIGASDVQEHERVLRPNLNRPEAERIEFERMEAENELDFMAVQSRKKTQPTPLVVLAIIITIVLSIVFAVTASTEDDSYYDDDIDFYEDVVYVDDNDTETYYDEDEDNQETYYDEDEDNQETYYDEDEDEDEDW